MFNPSLVTIGNLSIALIWLFHVSGILGIIYGDSEWFISATPINLSLCFVLVFLNVSFRPALVWVFALCFTVGMVAEILGVNYGLIFGDYQYGEAMGTKLYGVPLLIGVNWFVSTMITAAIADHFGKKLWQKLLLGVSFMLFLDLLMEPVAPVLDYWEFEGGHAPLQNFIGWAAIALPLQALFHKTKMEFKNAYPYHLFLLQILFFAILLLKSNTLGL